MAATALRPEISAVRSMKSFGLTPHLLSATLFLGLAARGESQENTMTTPGSPAAKSARRAEDLLKRFDRDGDGKLDDDERADAKEAMMKEQVDGQMARAASVPGGPEAFRQRMLEMFDRNQDGRLDDEERAAAQKFAAERGFGPGGELRADLIKRFDRNGNGRIDEDERPALQEFARQQMASAAKETAGEATVLARQLRVTITRDAGLMQRFDTDQDGSLSDEEWAAARRRLVSALQDRPAAGPDDPKAEQRRLEAVAAEVQRRRKIREEQSKAVEKTK